MGGMFSNPCERVDAPKLNRREARYLTEEQTAALLESLANAPLQYQVMINLMVFTGARRGEICGLEWSDIDRETHKLHIQRNSLYLPGTGMYEDTTKTEGSDRTISIPESLVELLDELKAEQDSQRSQMGTHGTTAERFSHNGMENRSTRQRYPHGCASTANRMVCRILPRICCGIPQRLCCLCRECR